jgi:4,5-DOPA dioxygenase extradiol
LFSSNNLNFSELCSRHSINFHSQNIPIRNIVHNLRLLQWNAAEPYLWAAEFDRLAMDLILSGEHDRLVAYPSLGEAARLSIPTNEHYLPLLYILALQQPGEPVTFFAEGLPLGSISMRSVRIG